MPLYEGEDDDVYQFQFKKGAYLRYFIVDKNVQFIRHNNKAYVQAKLNVCGNDMPSENEVANDYGNGYCLMKAYLFEVSAPNSNSSQLEPK